MIDLKKFQQEHEVIVAAVKKHLLKDISEISDINNITDIRLGFQKHNNETKLAVSFYDLDEHQRPLVLFSLDKVSAVLRGESDEQ